MFQSASSDLCKYVDPQRGKSTRPTFFEHCCPACRERPACSDSPMNAPKTARKWKERKNMKYILLMAGTKAGVDAYSAWPKKDIQAHFAFLKRLNNELSESGEFVASQGLGPP